MRGLTALTTPPRRVDGICRRLTWGIMVRQKARGMRAFWRPRGPAARIVRMAHAARIVTWNGKVLPPEMRELPAGRYVVESVDLEAPPLSPDEDAGIEAALESYRQGRIVDAKRARAIIDATLGR